MTKQLFLFMWIIGLSGTVSLSAQNPTLSQKQTERESATLHKILIIPFEQKLYMSEIDRFINAESGLSAKQIRHLFRDGINEQVYKACRASKFGAVDLMEDTAKSKKDLALIYQYLSYEYVTVPDQQHYQAPRKEKSDKKIDKGQLVVETSGDQKFMDARIGDAKVLSTLKSKHRTDLFLFINELDIKASGNKGPTELGEGNPRRKITVHYTLYDSAGKELNSGIVEEEFDPTLNNPKKIIDKHFSLLAITLARRTQLALAPVR